MSAIFGIIDFEGRPIQDEWITSMQKDLAHRGPDRQAIYREESMFFGHMLLQVTPESIYDKSPYEEDGFVITAYARLDEREAIMDRIGTPLSKRETITDPLLLLRSYIKFGKDFVKDIYGDFAFAIWNKDKREIYCARDQIGIKPFVYYFEDHRLIFSTELKSLVELSIVYTEINHTNILQDYFDSQAKLGTTIWKNIKRLPAAHYYSATSEKFELSKYWTLKYLERGQYKTVEESGTALKIAMERAIKNRMRTTSEVGVPLSGGLDSSSIACVAARIARNKNREIYSVSSMLDPAKKDNDTQDESEFINAILAKEKNIKPDYFDSSQLQFLSNLTSRFDRHYAIYSPFNYVDEALYKRFEKVNVRRLLSGFIGDMTVSNRSLLPLPHLLKDFKLRKLTSLSLQIKDTMGLSNFELLKYHLVAPLSPTSVKRVWSMRKAADPDHEFEIPVHLDHPEHKRILMNMKSRNRYISEYSFRIEDHILPTDTESFREDFDTGSSHYQIEYTYPLMDRRVLEVLMKVPIEHFYARGFQRGLIREAMQDYIPSIIRKRKDKGYYSPGFTSIIRKDIPEIINTIEEGNKKHPELQKRFDIEKVVSNLKELAEQSSAEIFLANQWNNLYIAIWILYDIWNLNKKYGE
ncbi:asparagine synthase-related protein [Christiangramia sp. ASW11-125]|uniref:asparagine synthase-related protein n=1 Tax=Christiangramia sp. ASW11-125 TaxID=3400701 RepID=UPI003AAD6C99